MSFFVLVTFLTFIRSCKEKLAVNHSWVLKVELSLKQDEITEAKRRSDKKNLPHFGIFHFQKKEVSGLIQQLLKSFSALKDLSCFENAVLYFIGLNGLKDNMASYLTVSDILRQRIRT